MILLLQIIDYDSLQAYDQGRCQVESKIEGGEKNETKSRGKPGVV